MSETPDIQPPDFPTQPPMQTPVLYPTMGPYVVPTQQPRIDPNFPVITEENDGSATPANIPPNFFPPPESLPPQLGPEDYPSRGNPPPAPDSTTEFNRISRMVQMILAANNPPDLLNQQRPLVYGLTSGTTKWKELTASGTSIAVFPGGMSCTSATGANQMLFLSGATQGMGMEIPCLSTSRYVGVGNAPLLVNVQQTGGTQGGTTSAYSDFTYKWALYPGTNYLASGHVQWAGGRISGPVTSATVGMVQPMGQNKNNWKLISVGEKPASSSPLFPVTLTSDGGDNGGSTAGTAATWTYTLKDINTGTTLKKADGTTNATGYTPTQPRPPWQAAAATEGQAYRKADGTLVLAVAYETWTYCT
jgi:hypothetical protein